VDLVHDQGNSVELLMGGVRHILLKGIRGVKEESSSDGSQEGETRALHLGSHCRAHDCPSYQTLFSRAYHGRPLINMLVELLLIFSIAWLDRNQQSQS